MENKPQRFPPAAVSGFFLGILCLVGALALYILEPNFAGFFDRNQGEPPLPIWIVLLGLAGLNFVYALFSIYMYRKVQRENDGLPLDPNK